MKTTNETYYKVYITLDCGETLRLYTGKDQNKAQDYEGYAKLLIQVMNILNRTSYTDLSELHNCMVNNGHGVN